MTVKDSTKPSVVKIILWSLLLAALIGSLAVWVVWFYAGSGGLGQPQPVPAKTPTSEQMAAPKVEQQIVTIDLTGKWTTKINETTFNVEVADEKITIKMSKNGSTMLYWYGTFNNRGAIGEDIISTKLNINKAVLSSASSKSFSVKANTIAFDVSAMGQTKNVEVTHA